MCSEYTHDDSTLSTNGLCNNFLKSKQVMKHKLRHNTLNLNFIIKAILLTYLQPHQQTMCDRFPSKCPNDGCQQVFPRNEVIYYCLLKIS